jgi:opacity protein-like surface antigen
MKKLILPFLSLTMMLSSFTSNAQCVEQGSVLIDAYYGFPNLYSKVFKAAYANTGTELNLKFSSIGPVGVRAEYMLADKIGLGLDLGMNSSSISYDEETSVYNSTTGNYENTTYNYGFVTRKIGALVTFNFHFVSTDALDVYSVLGVGYGSRTFAFTSTEPGFSSPTISSLVPVAMRVGVGMRYFFTENIGANIGLGFGHGGLLNAGLSVKF